MILFILILGGFSVPKYVLDGTTLVITGDGEITLVEIQSHRPDFFEIVDVQAGITSIGTNSFQNCNKFWKIILPDSLQEIHSGAFQYTNLKELHIPKNVNYINPSYLIFFANKFEKYDVDIRNIYYSSFNGCLYNKNQTVLISYPYLKIENDFPSTVVEFSTWSFSWNPHKTLHIPDTVKKMNSMSFVGYPAPEVIFGENSKIQNIPSNCFYVCGLKSFTCPPSLKSISSNAFAQCNIKTFNFTGNSTLTVLSDLSFYQCTKLESVTLPSSIQTISSTAFSGCSSLKSIQIIGNSSYYETYNDCLYSKGLKNLIFVPDTKTELEVPSETQTIAQNIIQFSNIVNLTADNDYLYAHKGVLYNKSKKLVYGALGTLNDVFILKEAEKMVDSCFAQMNYQTIEFEADSNMNSIPYKCFQKLRGVSTLIIPGKVTKILSQSFEDSGFQTIYIPSSVTSIYYAAFRSSAVTNVTFGEGDEPLNFESESFKGCSQLQYFQLPNRSSYLGYTFLGSSLIKSLYVPGSVVTLYSSCFASMPNLVNLTFDPSLSISTLPASMCYECVLLQNVFLHPSTKAFDNNCFKNCRSIKYIELTKTQLVNISAEAFSGCTSLTSVVLPVTIREVDSLSFVRCYSLISIETDSDFYSSYLGTLYTTYFEKLVIFPGGLSECQVHSNTSKIGENAFYEAINLKVLNFSEGGKVSEIGARTFFGCSSLQHVVLPGAIERVLSAAFESCVSLSFVGFGSGKEDCYLRDLGPETFSNCSSLREVDLSHILLLDSIQKKTFYDCSQLASIAIPGCIKTIGESAFSGCSSLSSITFDLVNSRLTLIERSAFEGSGIENISIPNNVTSINEFALSGCLKLEYVKLPSELSYLGSYSLSGCTRLSRIVFCGSNRFDDTSVLFGYPNPNSILVSVLTSYAHRLFCGVTVRHEMSRCGLFPTNPFTEFVHNDGTVLLVYEIPLLTCVCDGNDD